MWKFALLMMCSWWRSLLIWLISILCFGRTVWDYLVLRCFMLCCCVSGLIVRNYLITQLRITPAGTLLTSVSFTEILSKVKKVRQLPSIDRWFDYIDKPLTSWSNVTAAQCLQRALRDFAILTLRLYDPSCGNARLPCCLEGVLITSWSCFRT